MDIERPHEWVQQTTQIEFKLQQLILRNFNALLHANMKFKYNIAKFLCSPPKILLSFLYLVLNYGIVQSPEIYTMTIFLHFFPNTSFHINRRARSTALLPSVASYLLPTAPQKTFSNATSYFKPYC